MNGYPTIQWYFTNVEKYRKSLGEGVTLEEGGESAMGLYFGRQEALELVRSLSREMPISKRQVEKLIEEALSIDRITSVEKLVELCVKKGSA